MAKISYVFTVKVEHAYMYKIRRFEALWMSMGNI